MLKYKIRTKDRVVVMTGKSKGKIGEILKVLTKKQRVIVKGVNMVKRHRRPSRTSQGGIIDQEAPLHISNVAYVDPKTNQPTRIGFTYLKDGRKVRYAKRSGEIIDS